MDELKLRKALEDLHVAIENAQDCCEEVLDILAEQKSRVVADDYIKTFDVFLNQLAGGKK